MNRILNKSSIGVAALLGVSNLTVSAAKSTDTKPDNRQMNIVMMFVDDLGWADLGLRNPHYNTPNVNSLFADGMNFERAYVTQPASSPSRASLMTGKQPVRFQLVRHIDNRVAGESDEFSYWPKNTSEVDDYMPSRNWLPMEQVIFPQLMNECGYYNMFVGKWHLGGLIFGQRNADTMKSMECLILVMCPTIMLRFSDIEKELTLLKK
ncbi:sulfatase-like hydrolase/transferase [Bacteroides thetaiotaomicron]|nr:sulfatase-like hydrolase/transferase [Bacteroides thetaiotaomicron]